MMTSSASTDVTDIEKALLALVARELPQIATKIHPSTSLTHDLALDSMQMMQVVVAIENEFKVCLDSDTNAETADSLHELALYISKYRDMAASELLTEKSE